MMENQLQTILNHLGDTGVYVVRQDTHEILYFNDRVKRVTPQVELGCICHELWAGTCVPCPLMDMADKQTNTVISYDDPFGEVVDISATRMRWGPQEIPAFLISVTPHTQSIEEQAAALERDRLARVAAKVYPLILSLDLTQDEYLVIESPSVTERLLPHHGRYTDFLAALLAHVPGEQQPAYRARLALPGLLEAFGRGAEEVYHECQCRSVGGECRWISLRVLKTKAGPDGHLLAMVLCQDIEEQKQAEQQLRRERAAIFESLPGGVVKIAVGEEIRVLEASRAYCSLFGQVDVPGPLAGIYPADEPNLQQVFGQKAAQRLPIALDFRFQSPTGRVGWVHCEGKLVDQEQGVPVYQCAVLDITEKKQVQLALEQKQLEYQLAVERGADALFEYLPEEDLLLCHESPASGGRDRRLEHCLERLPQLQVVHPADREMLQALLRAEVRQAEIRLREPGAAGYTWLLVQGDALCRAGKPEKIIGTLRNISASRQREQSLKAQQKLISTTLDTVIASAFDELHYLDLTRNELVLLKCNKAYRTPKDMAHPGFEENLLATIHPRHRRAFREKFSRDGLLRTFDQGGSRVYQEGLRLGNDGKYHWISLEAIHVEDSPDGHRMALLLLSTIDDKKQLEQESQIMAASILATFGELIVLDMKNSQYVVHKADDSTSAMLETTQPAPFTPHNRRYGEQLIHPDDQAAFFECFQLDRMRRQIEQGTRKFYLELRRKNGQGEYRWCEMIGTVVENNTGDDYNVLLTFRDIHELRLAQREQREANRRFMMAVNSFYDAIYEIDLYSREIHPWKEPNDQVGDLWGHEQCTDEEFYTHIHPDYRSVYQQKIGVEGLLTTFRSGKTEVEAQVPYFCRDEVYRWFAIQVQLLEMTPDKLRVMVYLKNVDDSRREEQRKQDALRDALALAEQSSQAKSSFLSRMSHDIRTPMNAIMGMSAIAAANLEDPAKIRDCLGKIDVSAKFLLSLINDVLDMSKIESGKMRINLAPFDMRGLLRELDTLCGDQAREKGQDFRVEVAPEVEQMYVGDALRLNQVLMNLLTNAMKYTPAGGRVRLRAKLENQNPERAYLCLVVEDNGIGMSAEFQKRLFEPFEQERVDGGRLFAGSGLGLSITRNLVHLMNGQILVKSAPGKGSEFTVIVPLGRVGQPSGGPAPSERAEDVKAPSFSGERVLLVEDSELNREIAQTLLEMAGLLVDTAENGRVAVEKFSAAAAGYYQAVIMDIRMPEMDGLEATRRIRALERPDAGLPVIAMTANAFQEERQQAQAAGITDYLTKPVDVDQLYKTLGRAMQKR